MRAISNMKQTDFTALVERNKRNVRELVMTSYQDIHAGKGCEYDTFFDELEEKYRKAGL